MKNIALILCAAALCGAADFSTGQAARALFGQSVFTGQDSVPETLLNLTQVSVSSGPDGIVGRSVVIHADPDDYKSQPAGNSGKRVACGVIGGL